MFKYDGRLLLYYETGMECVAPALHDFRGVTTGPSFNNDTKKYDGPPQEYHSMKWTYFFSKRPVLAAKIWDENGIEVYSGPLTYDRKKMHNEKYRYSFMPEEIPMRDFAVWCGREFKAEITVSDPVDAEKFNQAPSEGKERE